MAKSNRQYWVDRELQHAKDMLKDEQVIEEAMKTRYRQAGREIEKEINSLLEKFASDEGLSMADVNKQVAEIDIRDYEDKAARYVKERNFSDIANHEMKRYNLKMKVSRLELLKSHIDLELIDLADDVDKAVYDRLLEVGEGEVKRQAGILGEHININAEAVEYIAKQKFHGEDFSETIWKNKGLLHRELEERLTELITKGQNPRKAARILRETVESGVYESERILRTESARVQNEIQMESYKELEIDKYEFIALEDSSELGCDICPPLDGQIFKVSEQQPGINANPMHPNCRCSTAPYIDREEVMERIENM